MANNTTSIVRILPDFEMFWKRRRKDVKSLNIPNLTNERWVIAADYCLNDKGKPYQSIAFTVFPYLQPYQLDEDMKRYLPQDIKHTTKLTPKMINFLKNNQWFYSIVFMFKDINEFDEKTISETFCKWTTFDSVVENKEKYKELFKFSEYCKRKNINDKLIKNLFFIVGLFSLIAEFLVIKENAKDIVICSDRDAITEFSDGIFYQLLDYELSYKVKSRKKTLLTLMLPNEKTNKFEFDSYIRVPDYFAGATASFNLDEFTVDKDKHKEILLEVLKNNDKVILYKVDVQNNQITYSHILLDKLTENQIKVNNNLIKGK